MPFLLHYLRTEEKVIQTSRLYIINVIMACFTGIRSGESRKGLLSEIETSLAFIRIRLPKFGSFQFHEDTSLDVFTKKTLFT